MTEKSTFDRSRRVDSMLMGGDGIGIGGTHALISGRELLVGRWSSEARTRRAQAMY